jgi:hypothetical protein
MLLKKFPAFYGTRNYNVSIIVAATSKAWTVFARSSAGILGSNSTQAMGVCVCVYFVCVVLCVGSGLATDTAAKAQQMV